MSAKIRLSARRRAHATASPAPVWDANTEANAVEAARRGDLRAWEYITRRYQELVFRSAYLVTRDSTPAEQATKTAFVRAYRSLGSHEQDEQLAPWFMGIVHTVAHTSQRELARLRDAKVPEPDSSPRFGATPIPSSAGVPRPTLEESDALVDAFDGLSDVDRLVIASRYAFGLTRSGAATRLRIGEGEVDGRLSAAMGRLRTRTLTSMAQNAGSVTDPRAGAHHGAARLMSFTDDQIGPVAMAAYYAQLPWSPDVAPAVCARLDREAIAYPEARAAAPQSQQTATDLPSSRATTAPTQRSQKRRGSKWPRLVGTVAGITLVTATVFTAGGGVTGAGWELPHELQDGIDTVLGESAGAATAVAALDTAQAPPPLVIGAPAAPTFSVVGAERLAGGRLGAVVRVNESWLTEPETIDRSRLERKLSDGPWQAYPWAQAQEPLLATLEQGPAYQFRVRAVAPGGGEMISPVSSVELGVRDPRSKRLALSKGDWDLRRRPSGDRRVVAVAPGARARTAFHGTDVAVIGAVGPSSGAFGIRLDGGDWVEDPAQTVRSLGSTLLSEDLDGGRHTLDIRALDDGLAVEAILILRSRAL